MTERSARMQVASRYVLFALIAGAVNLLAQASALWMLDAVVPGLYPAAHLTAAMAVGTVAGLFPKYLLDSRWIFIAPDRAVPVGRTRTHARNLPLYTLTSVFTTFVFWAFEYLFDMIRGGNWHYVGAVIGLAIGYRVKYALDRTFVFNRVAPAAA